MSRKCNVTNPLSSKAFIPRISFFLRLSLPESASQQHISCNVPPSHVLCFSRQGFTRPRLPVRWSSLGLPNTLSFSRRMFRSVVVHLSLSSTETLLCGCQNRPVPGPAPGWPQALSRGFPLLPGRPRMLQSDKDGCAGDLCGIGWDQIMWCRV